MGKVSVIVPTYKEEENLKKLIPDIFKALPQAEVVIVDDNSPDRTPALIKSLKRRYTKLHLIIRREKAGRGSAVLEGFKYALDKFHSDFYIEMDADFSHNPAALPRLVAASKPHTVVIASRYIAGSTIAGWPMKRRITSFFSNQIIRFLLGTKASDNTNGLRGYPKDAVKILLSHTFLSSGFIVLSESLYLLRKKGYKIAEVPFDFQDRRYGTSNTTISEFTNALLTLIRLRLSR